MQFSDTASKAGFCEVYTRYSGSVHVTEYSGINEIKLLCSKC